MVKIALNLRAVLSCERDQTCSIRAPPVRPFALSLNISLARSPAVSLTSLRLRWVDDPRGMSRSTPSMTARLFFLPFSFHYLLHRDSFVTGPGRPTDRRVSGLPRVVSRVQRDGGHRRADV